MAWRKWVVRGTVFCSLGGLALVALLYQFFTNPEAIRRKVLERLQEDFVGVNASVGSARLRLFGGIAVQEVRLARRDDLDKTDFLYVPSAVLYHDKEHLLKGSLSIRKVEINRPRLRAVRRHDGTWNLAGLLKPSDPTRPMPTVVIRQGTLVVEDRLAAAGTAPLEIKNLDLTLVNDPLPTVSFEGSGECDVAGLVKVHGQLQRDGLSTLRFEAPAFAIGPELVQRLAGCCPEAAAHARQLWAKGRLSGSLAWGGGGPPSYAVELMITDGGYSHARLPWPLTHLRGTITCADGVLGVKELHAEAGAATIDLSVGGLILARVAAGAWPDAVRGEARLAARHVPVDDELFKYLPDDLRPYQRDYSPSGKAGFSLTLRREGAGWSKVLTVEPEDLRVVYALFQYPATRVHGSIEVTTAVSQAASLSGPTRAVLDLRGEASGTPVHLKGTVEDDGDRTAVKLDLDGHGLPLSESLLAAVPAKCRDVARTFHPTGLVDYKVFIRCKPGEADTTARYLIHLHHGTVCYDEFPLPLVGVSGTLDVRPDHWEFWDFVGRHKDGVIRASGRSQPVPQPVPAPPGQEMPDRVALAIQGQGLPLDRAFEAALGKGRESLAQAWKTFALTGRLNFTARIDDLPNQPQDIDVTVGIDGCRMDPSFFPYALADVGATVRYAKGSAWVSDFRGRHGKTLLGVKQATVHFPREGGFWVKLDRLRANPLLLDSDLGRALPPALRKTLDTLKLRQPVALDTELIVKQPADPTSRPIFYWDGVLGLKDAALQTGIDWTGVTGTVSSRGLYNGDQLEDVVGHAFLEQATVLNQPLRQVHVPLMVWKDTPDVLRMPGVAAQFFGGTLSGEARVEFGSIFRYELVVRAQQVQLEQFGRHNFGTSAELSGLAEGGIHLKNEDDRLWGNGVVNVPSGKLYRLPLLLDLLKWLGLSLPDRTAFEQAHAEFGIDGDRVKIDKLDLYGRAVSVRGEGAMKLDGSDIDLVLNADWGRLSQVLPAAVNDLSRGLSNQLLRIKVRGKVGDVRFEKELVPVVTDPLKRVWTGLAGGQKKQ